MEDQHLILLQLFQPTPTPMHTDEIISNGSMPCAITNPGVIIPNNNNQPFLQSPSKRRPSSK